MSLAKWAVARPVSVFVLTLAVLVLGAVRLPGLSLDLLPQMNLPTASVAIIYPGASPQSVENEITKPLEQALTGLAHLQSISTYSLENVGVAVLQFDWGTSIKDALADIRSQVDRLALSLPTDAEPPLVLATDPSQLPVLMLAFTGQDLTKLSQLLQNQVLPAVAHIDGVAQASLEGAVTPQIRVTYNQEKLRQTGLTPDLLQQVLKAANVYVPATPLQEGDRLWQVRTGYSLHSLDDLANVVVGVKAPAANPLMPFLATVPTLIRLKDVARIERVAPPPAGITRVNGQPAVVLRITKRSDANTIAVVDAVQNRLHQLGLDQKGVRVYPVVDQSLLVRQSVRSLTWAGGIGALLSVLSLFLFLGRRWREVLLIGLSIPFSVAVTLLGMGWFGQTLNVMTLGGLAMGMGMVVDNAIVVVENTTRLHHLGYPLRQAAALGAEQVDSAIIASTLTTVAVFFPVLLVRGLSSELLGSLGLTVTLALLASLLVAVTLIPAAASRLLGTASVRVKQEPQEELAEPRLPVRQAGLSVTLRSLETAATAEPLTTLPVRDTSSLSFSNEALGEQSRLTQWYGRALDWALGHKPLILGGTGVFFLSSLLLIPGLGIDLLPVPDSSVLTVQVTLPPGSSSTRTLTVVTRLEQEIRRHREVAWVATQAGSQGTADVSSILAGGADQAQLTIALRPGDQGSSATRLAAQLNQALARTVPPDVRVSVAAGGGFGSLGHWSDNSLHTEIRGPDIRTVEERAAALAQALRATSRFPSVQVESTQGLPELRYTVSPARAAMAALIPGQVGLAVRQALSDTPAFTITLDNGESLPVVIRPELATDGRSLDRTALSQLEISSLLSEASQPSAGASLLPTGPATLGRVATLTETTSPALVYRVNGQPTVAVTAQLGQTSQADGARLLAEALRQLDLPPGYSAQVVGTQQMIDDTLRQLEGVLALSIFLVWVVMAVQFESAGQALLLLMAVPLGATGAILALAITHTTVSLSSLMGLVILGGIIVNNAIVLIDRINQLRQAGVPLLDAVRSGCRTRLRPVLMTALTTIVGLIPLLVGPFSHDSLQSPLAISLAGGLALGTVLTLIVIPVLYEGVGRWQERRWRAKVGNAGRKLVAETEND